MALRADWSRALVPAGSFTRSLMARVRVLAVGVGTLAVLLLVGAAASSAAGTSTLTVYSVATGVQFINTADDRARGKINNPFGAAVNKLSPKATSTGNGPFPGDVVVYAVNLYKEKTLRGRAGSGVYTCYFNYDRNAFCEAYFELSKSNTVVASGPIDFKKTGFTIVITGGTRKYLGARGEVDVVKAARASQKIDFHLLS